MRKIFNLVLAFIVAGGVVAYSYRFDMQTKLKALATERLATINYQTLQMDFEEMSIYKEVKDKLEGKSLEQYIVDQCEMTENIRLYFQVGDKSKPEYYQGVRDIENQLIVTIDDLCNFLNEQDKLHPKVYLESNADK